MPIQPFSFYKFYLERQKIKIMINLRFITIMYLINLYNFRSTNCLLKIDIFNDIFYEIFNNFHKNRCIINICDR